jgi:putative ABC transport system permease protein
MAYDVSQKLQEISIRIALGASSTRIRNLVLGKAVSLALFGVAIGSLATLFATRWITSLLFGVRATDPVIFASASTLLILVSIAASYVPIRRAMAVDPLTALRSE